MKEVIAIIRRQNIHMTKTALDGLGFVSMSIISVSGRGKQKGFIGEVDPAMAEILPDAGETDPIARFIPKRMLMLVTEDEYVAEIVETIMRVNRTGYLGDGKIFVCPIEDAVRIRTGERGVKALR
ncbi:P-II family nitrogen regulator [Mahella sp.]|uniref:P-II family nitrogen regulator n=1 Tax=Mahella sp. TaxID=2798721 RepID=UPI0025C0D35A|nr:P-II family nitrogen regulator [Mahella sp.]MBZ4666126.1 nitrogen regulatory protein [Mahella sp.]